MIRFEQTPNEDTPIPVTITFMIDDVELDMPTLINEFRSFCLAIGFTDENVTDEIGDYRWS